jgi:hypothetical protein
MTRYESPLEVAAKGAVAGQTIHSHIQSSHW